MINENCTQTAFHHMEDALAVLLKGLKDYKDSEIEGTRADFLDGISHCQLGSRNAMMGLLLWNIPMGASHAIGHQLGSVCGVMHGITSCIMLAPVLRYTYDKSEQQKEVQRRVLDIWNKVLRWEEKLLADAVGRFVKMLELPSTLTDVGIENDEDIEKVAESTLTDVFANSIGGKKYVLEILDMAKK